MLCVIETEEETGGNGAGEVSTGAGSENMVRRRRAVVTRRLVLLSEGPSIVIMLPNRARIGVPNFWRRHSMMLCFVPLSINLSKLLVCSMLLTHVFLF